MGRPEPVEEASRILTYANSATDRAAALRVVLKNTTTRADEDQLLWMTGVHYRPDLGGLRRDAQYGSRVATSRRKGAPG